MPRPLNVWSWASVQCLLLQSLIHLSASDPSNSNVFSQVGQEVTLPCHCRSTIDPAKTSKHPYLWWETPMESVFELEGPLRFEAPKYRGRVDVGLLGFEEEGNCSLLLQAVRFSDAGLYESFVRVGRRRRFIGSVELNVRDHKDSKTLAEGGRLHLKLHTTQDVTVVFQGKDAKAGEIWRRWGEGEGKAVGGRQGRLVEREGALILSEVKLEDSGTYRVLDPQGLAVSTLLLTVEPEAEPVQPAEGQEDANSSAGRASGTSPIISALMLFSYFCLKL